MKVSSEIVSDSFEIIKLNNTALYSFARRIQEQHCFMHDRRGWALGDNSFNEHTSSQKLELLTQSPVETPPIVSRHSAGLLRPLL